MKYTLYTLCLLLSTLALAQSGDYEKKILDARKKKDKEFRKSSHSPLPTDERRHFHGLHYFPVDSTYRVMATLVKDSVQPTLQMKTSTSRLPVYARYGEIHFTLHGQKLKLTVYQSRNLMKPVTPEHFFLPFLDTHTGESTYEAGRYIEPNLPKEGNTFILDFNEAYNPYCAYGGNYSCPMTPEENRLPVSISAGEKKYKEHP